MASKNGSIPASYIVGEVPEFMNLMVEKITYHRSATLYNKGFQTNKAGYSVVFANSEIRHLIPEKEVIQVGVDIEKEEKASKKQYVPELPVSENIGEDQEAE
jgi:hypothetical protein